MFPTYLTHQSGQHIVSSYLNSTSYAQTVGKPFVMFETNTASCGGFPGVSDSFGAALWALDYALTMAYSNFTGALFHVGGQNVYYNVCCQISSKSLVYWTSFNVQPFTRESRSHTLNYAINSERPSQLLLLTSLNSTSGPLDQSIILRSSWPKSLALRTNLRFLTFKLTMDMNIPLHLASTKMATQSVLSLSTSSATPRVTATWQSPFLSVGDRLVSQALHLPRSKSSVYSIVIFMIADWSLLGISVRALCPRRATSPGPIRYVGYVTSHCILLANLLLLFRLSVIFSDRTVVPWAQKRSSLFSVIKLLASATFRSMHLLPPSSSSAAVRSPRTMVHHQRPLRLPLGPSFTILSRLTLQCWQLRMVIGESWS